MKFKDAITKSVEKLSSHEFIERVKEEDDTMLAHLDILKLINKNGYITNESQAGRKSSGISFFNKNPYTMCERAYISGFMLESKAEQFIKNISLDTDKIAMFIPFCKDDVYMPATLDIPLTISIQKTKTTINTHSASVLPHSVWEMYRKELNINKTEKIVFVFCVDLKWNRNASSSKGLFTDIVKILKKI